MKKIKAILLTLIIAIVPMIGTACKKEVPTVDNANFDQSNLYGVCYLLEEREFDPYYDMQKEVQLMKNLGVKTVRQWMHFSNLMYDKNTLKKDACEKMHTLLKLCSDNGMVNVGMNHHNFNKGSNTSGKPYKRDLSNQNYIEWLNDYYTSWYTLVSEFPEVEYWEIDNEVNNSDFMRDANGQNVYNQLEMAEIATDMFYYASRAIHDANPKAKTVMGGLTEPNGLGSGTTASFLQKLYDNIASGEFGYFYNQESKSKASKNADDYFQVACWHPYVWNSFDAEEFVEINNEYYEVILKNEGKHKEVFFTEIGFNDVKCSEDMAASYIEEMFNIIKTKMKYVSQVHYYKMYDVGTTTSWEGGGTYSRFGLFYDPDISRKYPLLDGVTTAVNGKAKSKAYKFQQLAGGSGDLDLLVNSK
ncbi:MAG TPA: hypothetical protein VIL26_00895 [Clostridia bacterium]